MIKQGGQAALLHHIFQRTGVTPGEFWAKPRGEKLFMLASMEFQLEEEQRAARKMQKQRG